MSKIPRYLQQPEVNEVNSDVRVERGIAEEIAKRCEEGDTGFGFSVFIIFSSKCSIAILDMSLNSVRISWDLGNVLLFSTNLRTRYISSMT